MHTFDLDRVSAGNLLQFTPPKNNEGIAIKARLIDRLSAAQLETFLTTVGSQLESLDLALEDLFDHNAADFVDVDWKSLVPRLVSLKAENMIFSGEILRHPVVLDFHFNRCILKGGRELTVSDSAQSICLDDSNLKVERLYFGPNSLIEGFGMGTDEDYFESDPYWVVFDQCARLNSLSLWNVGSSTFVMKGNLSCFVEKSIDVSYPSPYASWAFDVSELKSSADFASYAVKKGWIKESRITRAVSKAR